MAADNLYSIEAEQEVIGSLLSNPACFDDAFEIVDVADFYSVQHQRIINEFVRQRDVNPNMDISTVIFALGESNHSEDFNYAYMLAGNATGSRNIKTYARVVLERAKLRRLREALQEAVENIDSTKSSDEIIDFAQSRLVELESKKFTSDIQHSNDVLKSMIANLDKRWRDKQAGVIAGLPTGFESLDERFNGMRNGHLIVLAARPSMGKSAMAMQIAQHVAINQKKGVLVFSLEMPTEELYERMAATQGYLSYKRIRDGELQEDDWAKLSAAVSKLKDSPIWVVDRPGLHINQMRAYSRKANRRHPLGLIVVDHINIAKGDGKQREQEVASISGGLKALAKEIGCPVIALCQLNRDVESNADKRPLMSHLRESGAIEQDADIVTFLYRDDYYNENSPHKGIVEVITRKFRGGQNGTDYLANRLDIMRFENLSREYMPTSEPTPIRGKSFKFKE